MKLRIIVPFHVLKCSDWEVKEKVDENLIEQSVSSLVFEKNL